MSQTAYTLVTYQLFLYHVIVNRPRLFKSIVCIHLLDRYFHILLLDRYFQFMFILQQINGIKTPSL